MKRLLSLLLILTLTAVVCDAGDIKFNRYGNTTRFRGNGISGSIYDYGNGNGRIRYDYNNNYSYQPQFFYPIDTRVQFGANAPLYVQPSRAWVYGSITGWTQQ